jgi:hypothetical protein
MGFFKNAEIDVIEMYRLDGMKERAIATATGLSVLTVQEIIAAYERGDLDYDIADTDAEVVSYDELTFDPDDSDYNAEHY